MIIYGLKRVELNTSQLSVPCAECGHEHQWLHIYRNFFSLYFFPIIPLRKAGIVSCPGCSTELKKKAFFKQLDDQEYNHAAKHDVESVFNSARTPLYWFIAPICLIVIIMGVLTMSYHKSELEKQFLNEYRQNPSGNVIVISKSPTDVYPYFITYVPEVKGEYAAVFAWNYSYETMGDAKNAAHLASKSLSEGKLSDHFSEPYVILSESLQSENIVHVDPQERLAPWKQYVPIEDPERILKIFHL